MLRYDEARMAARLARFDRAGRASFAAACGELLLPLHRRLAPDGSQPDALSGALDDVWGAIAGTSPVDLDTRLAEIDDLAPEEDAGSWSVNDGFSENAVSAVAYAIETWTKDSVECCVWAARQVYEAADLAAQHGEESGIDLNGGSAEHELLSSTVVQECLDSLEGLLVDVGRPGVSMGDLRAGARVRGEAAEASYPGRPG